MKTLNIVLLFGFVLLMSLNGCEKENIDPNDTNGSERSSEEVNTHDPIWGDPYLIDIAVVDDDEKNVNFAIITDTHVDATNASWYPFVGYKYRDTDKVKRNRECVDDLNIDAVYHNCLGIVHMGDLVDDNNPQNLVAFRQMWENDYPGHDGGSIAGVKDTHYTAYSQGHKIKLPVFPTLGNHDSPPYKDDDKDCRNVAHYISARMPHTTPGIIGKYQHVAYAWRWGQYVFIQLGMWAGSYEHESNTETNHEKLTWLKNLLEDEVGDSNLGVIIFQHYGWDGFSRESRWWHEEMRNEELNILCRRENSDDPGNPYNILAIFTGHTHKNMHKSVHAGTDLNGNSIIFDNLVIRSGGSLTDDQYGYSIVYLTENELKVHSKNVKHNEWTYWTKSISVGK